MRQECLDCVRKHVGSALAIIPELFTEYPHHITRAVGELEQAYQEALRKYEPLARSIRAYRLVIEEAYQRLLNGADPAKVVEEMPTDEQLVADIHEEYVKLAAKAAAEDQQNADIYAVAGLTC
jgi:hypothetical protein